MCKKGLRCSVDGNEPLPRRDGAHAAEGLVLVGCDEVRAGANGGAPANGSRHLVPEVVRRSVTEVRIRRESVQRVEANPEALLVGPVDDRAQARRLAPRMDADQQTRCCVDTEWINS